MQGKYFQKLDSDTFPTIYGTYLYHFQIIPVNSLKLDYVQPLTLAVSTLFHSLVHSFQSVLENGMIQGYLTKKLDFEQLTSRWRSPNYDVQQVETKPKVEGKKTTLKVILNHFSSFRNKFFFFSQTHLIHDSSNKMRCLQKINPYSFSNENPTHIEIMIGR